MVWHVASICLLLLACWQLASSLFSTTRARVGSVCLIAGLLTMPVAGTALYIMDQYLNPRNLAAFAGVFAVCRVLEKKYSWAAIWLVFSATIHPLMTSFAAALCVVLVVAEKVPKATAALALILP